MTTIDTITNAQIEALMHEAGRYGDMEMVDICKRALDGHIWALQECVCVIRSAQG